MKYQFERTPKALAVPLVVVGLVIQAVPEVLAIDACRSDQVPQPNVHYRSSNQMFDRTEHVPMILGNLPVQYGSWCRAYLVRGCRDMKTGSVSLASQLSGHKI